MRDRYDTARIVPVDSLKASYLGLDEGICDVVLTTIGTWETKKGDIVYNKDCKKEWVGRVVQFNDAGFSLRDSVDLCSSMLRDALSLHLLEMKRDKTYDTIWNTHRAKSVTNNCQDTKEGDDDSDTTQLNLKNVGGIFIVHAAVMVIGIALTFFVKNRRERKKSRLARAKTKDSNLNAHTNSTSNSAGVTAKIASGISDQDSDHDLHLAEQANNPKSNKFMGYVEAMEKNRVFMEAMKKQMDEMQAQLAQLAKEKQSE